MKRIAGWLTHAGTCGVAALAFALWLPRLAAACECADLGYFLDGVGRGHRLDGTGEVSVLRIRVVGQSPTKISREVHDDILGIKRRRTYPDRWPHKDVALDALVLETLHGPKPADKIRVAVPSEAACGPRDPAAFTKGSEWYVLAVPLNDDDSVRAIVRYVMWAPCGVPALRATRTHVIGMIRGASEELPVDEFRELVKRAIARSKSAAQQGAQGAAADESAR